MRAWLAVVLVVCGIGCAEQETGRGDRLGQAEHALTGAQYDLTAGEVRVTLTSSLDLRYDVGLCYDAASSARIINNTDARGVLDSANASIVTGDEALDWVYELTEYVDAYFVDVQAGDKRILYALAPSSGGPARPTWITPRGMLFDLSAVWQADDPLNRVCKTCYPETGFKETASGCHCVGWCERVCVSVPEVPLCDDNKCQNCPTGPGKNRDRLVSRCDDDGTLADDSRLITDFNYGDYL